MNNFSITGDKDDDELLQKIFDVLTERLKDKGSAYGSDSNIAFEMAGLPVGLRAMAATHHLDISLTLDSICWHFRNFGEPHLVALTEAGLRELELLELADCFHEAAEIMMPLADEDAQDWSDFLEKHGLEERVDAINRRAWNLDGGGKVTKSVIYNAWVKYARQHPENVFA